MLLLETPTLRLEIAENSLTLWDRARHERLIVGDDPLWLTTTAAGPRRLAQPSPREIVVTGPGTARTHWRVPDGVDAIDIQGEGSPPDEPTPIAPPGTILNLNDVLNFRHRHHIPSTFPELPLSGCTTSTYSDDWQFAPHPSVFVFRKQERPLFFGALDLPQAFGMHLSVANFRVARWYLDGGGGRFRLFFRPEKTLWQVLDEFGEMLVEEGLVPDPAVKRREPWWRAPLYCTWLDQCRKNPDDPQSCLDDGLVREAAALIRRERLPFRTILIDDGWQVARGQWEAHPQRFPNLRDLIDHLHARDFKVVLWWAWPEVEDGAQVESHFLMGDGQRNRHGARMLDFSRPDTQRAYLDPLLRRFFLEYDCDGVKTDFLADKIHPDMPLHDLRWRGEENYIVRFTQRFVETMRALKTDAVHIGCAGHFNLSPWIDINRTYDVFGADGREHEARAQMLRHTTPGCPVAYDFHPFLEGLDDYFASARRNDASVQIGNLFFVQDDPFAPVRPADPGYWETLRQNLRVAP